MTEFWLCFVPVFVAMDAIGNLPLFIALTAGLDRLRVRRVILQSVITATVVALVFLVAGKGIFRFLGITPADFMIAGGVLLFLFSVGHLLKLGDEQHQVDPDSLGAVPLGVPLIVGPAVLTTALILVGEHGTKTTAAAVMANILITAMVFACAGPINRVLGKSGAKTISKIAALFLAAIAVMMVRKGIMDVIATATA